MAMFGFCIDVFQIVFFKYVATGKVKSEDIVDS